MSLKVVKFDTKMYLNCSTFWGQTLAGGDKPWSKNRDKCRMEGGIGKIFAGWGDPQSPQEKNPKLVIFKFMKVIFHGFQIFVIHKF